MALSPIEDRYLSALTEREFPTFTPEESAMAAPEGVDGMQLAAGPSQTVSDAGGGMGEIKAIPRNKAQEALGYVGELLTKAGVQLDKYGVDIPGLGNITLKDLTVGDAGKVLEDMSFGFYPVRGGNSATGGIGTFGLKPDASMELLNVAPAAGAAAKAAVKGGVKAGKALAPKAAEMVLDAAEKTGMPVRGLGIVESSPQFVRERVPGVQPGEELIVQHNLTAANLLKADKLGGLPVPSLAISRAANPMDNFGEITLIAPKEFANPSAKNPVFGADAYTPRFPVIDFQIDSKSSKNLDKMFADTLAKIPDGKSEMATVKDEWKDKAYSRVMKAKFLDEQGLLPDVADFKDRYDFYAAVQTRVNDMRPEYEDWVNELDGKLADAGVTVKERIFKGYTYAGDRRYAAATLDNIVKEMKGGAGGEGFNYGVGNLRAVATPKFRTLSQIKASRGKLVDGKKMDEIKQQTQGAYVELLDRMRKVNERYSAEDALLEFAESKRISTLDKIYDGKMPDELKADIGIFLQKIQELPTEYFELKPQRAVSLEEFKGAIIPANTPKSARDVLTKAGITDIYEYNTPEERVGLFQKYGKEMFAAMPAAPMGAATMQDKEQK